MDILGALFFFKKYLFFQSHSTLQVTIFFETQTIFLIGMCIDSSILIGSQKDLLVDKYTFPAKPLIRLSTLVKQYIAQLAISIIDLLTCGFDKVITYIYLTTNPTKNENPVRQKNFKGKIIQEKYESLQRVLGTLYFNMNYTTFRNKYPKIINHIHKIGKKIQKSRDICQKSFQKKSGICYLTMQSHNIKYRTAMVVLKVL